MDVDVEQKISHFLLYRQPSHNRIWKCLSMFGRDEHQVFAGFKQGIEYEYVILAYNLRGECQLWNKIVIETDSSSNFKQFSAKFFFFLRTKSTIYKKKISEKADVEKTNDHISQNV